MRVLVGLVVAVLVGLAAAFPATPSGSHDVAAGLAQADSFGHAQHAAVFPTCVVCHAGATDSTAPIWPTPAACDACHDGDVEKTVAWSPPTEPAATNLRFAHAAHATAVAAHDSAPLRCVNCHAHEGAPWMSVERAAVPRCLSCHGITAEHVAAPDSACATCHVPLAEAPRLSAEDVRAFPTPPSHDDPVFAGRGGHGLLAWHPPAATTGGDVAASCATCHARDFCVLCHVDAPEQPAIRALAPDPRSLAHEAAVTEPGSHADHRFLETHGALARTDARECRTCHTQESCLQCHAATPERAAAMYAAGPERGRGATVERRPPETHTRLFLLEHHGDIATADPGSCAACHVRADCLDCHRPQAARAGGYHPPAFLARHPVAAYQQVTTCSDCHSTQQFCADCHQRAGLVTQRPLRGGFHDAKAAFLVGHGRAARQSLESCVTCHTERDCARCHATGVVGGRGFNPHGPGFEADRLRRRNPEPCRACHGTAIPGGS